MAEPNLNDLGVTAEAVDLVEDAVLAKAQAAASAAAEDDFEQTVATLDSQINVLRKEERSLEAQHTGHRQPAALSGLRKRLDHAYARRQRLIDARSERQRLALGEGAQPPSDVPDDKPASGESERDFLIRIGKLTPFQGQHGYERDQTKGQPIRRRVFNPSGSSLPRERAMCVEDDVDVKSLQLAPGAFEQSKNTSSSVPSINQAPSKPIRNSRKRQRVSEDRVKRGRNIFSAVDDEESDIDDGDNDSDEDFVPDTPASRNKVEYKKRKRTTSKNGRAPRTAPLSESDDGIESEQTAFTAGNDIDESVEAQFEGPEGDEYIVEEQEEQEFDGGLRMPASIFDRLFAYQRTGVSFPFSLNLQCQQLLFCFR